MILGGVSQFFPSIALYENPLLCDRPPRYRLRQSAMTTPRVRLGEYLH
jgi:hypothetical protein